MSIKPGRLHSSSNGLRLYLYTPSDLQKHTRPRGVPHPARQTKLSLSPEPPNRQHIVARSRRGRGIDVLNQHQSSTDLLLTPTMAPRRRISGDTIEPLLFTLEELIANLAARECPRPHGPGGEA